MARKNEDLANIIVKQAFEIAFLKYFSLIEAEIERTMAGPEDYSHKHSAIVAYIRSFWHHAELSGISELQARAYAERLDAKFRFCRDSLHVN